MDDDGGISYSFFIIYIYIYFFIKDYTSPPWYERCFYRLFVIRVGRSQRILLIYRGNFILNNIKFIWVSCDEPLFWITTYLSGMYIYIYIIYLFFWIILNHIYIYLLLLLLYINTTRKIFIFLVKYLHWIGCHVWFYSVWHTENYGKSQTRTLWLYLG